MNKAIYDLIKSINPDLNDRQMLALRSFIITEGVYHFIESRLCEMIRDNPKSAAISREFMRYTKIGGVKSDKLTKKRQEEIKLYFSEIE